MAQNMPNSHEAVKFMKPIPPLLIGLLLASCGGHSNKSVPEPVKTSAKVVAVSPVLLVGGSMIGGKKVAQKSAVATKAPAPWYSEEVSGERLRELMEPVKLIGNWHYMGSRGEHHFVSQDQIGRKIYRVLKSQYPIEKPFPLTPFPSSWRKIEIAGFGGEPFDPELLERFRDGNATEFLLLPEQDQ